MADKRNKKTKGTTRRRVEAKMECFFCKENKTPNFLEYELLSKFISERGKIQSRSRSGVCSKHQKKLTGEIKKARYIAFLPFVVRPE